jgi:hypothetical protein
LVVVVVAVDAAEVDRDILGTYMNASAPPPAKSLFGLEMHVRVAV